MKGYGKKNTLFEESLHIPFNCLCTWKKRSAETCSKLVELQDIYPTIIELTGLPKLSNLEGSSFAPLLDKPDLKWKRAVFSQIKRVKTRGDVMGKKQFELSNTLLYFMGYAW
jgi:arylsulfatase A-like enzyme